MASSDLRFKITDKVRIHVDLDRNRAVLSCKTEDGKSLDLEADYQTLDKIHEEIKKQLERY
jgi:hypothetical protein